MNDLTDASIQALQLLLSGDTEVWNIISVSFTVSLKAILIATVPAIAVAFVLAYYAFPGRRFVITLFNTALAIPAVVVGLTLYLLLSRSGPFGDLHLLFTQEAMIIGQIILAFPLLVAMSHASLQSSDQRAWETAITLGASAFVAAVTVIREVRFGLMAAVIAAFGRIIAEVGSSMMVGGNILNHTRNIPTAIALETSKGSFVEGIALGMVLLTLALLLNFFLTAIQGKAEVIHQ